MHVSVHGSVAALTAEVNTDALVRVQRSGGKTGSHVTITLRVLEHHCGAKTELTFSLILRSK